MPMPHHCHSLSSSSSTSSSYSPLLDALYCEEEELEEEEEDMDKVKETPTLLPILLLEHDMFWEDEELLSLFSKEQQIHLNLQGSISMPRREAVEWILKVNSYHGFSTLTAILSINYLDRFLSKSPHLHQHNKPWMIHLAAITCLSLAAKVEETHVPLLLDLQVEGTQYVFDAKTIQKMELLVLSTLEWKMNPVTPISFLDHILRRLGLKNHLHWEFLLRCEKLLISIITDSRFVSYLPSVLATATMMHVIDQIEPSNPIDYQNQLLSVLNFGKEKVKHCYDLLVEEASKNFVMSFPSSGNKRMRETSSEIPRSPSGVIEAHCFTSDGSNQLWMTCPGGGLSTSSSMSSSPEPWTRKKRVHEQHMPLRVFVD